MKLTWHITRKDLRRLALPLAGFVVVQLTEVGIGLTLRAGNGSDTPWFNRLSLYLNLTRGIEVVMVFVLVALLVQEDALVGTRVFWRTRPISSGILLRSKLLTGGLIFGLLPIMIALPWWRVCGYGLGAMGTASLEVLGWMVCIVLPASALAVLADNLGRFISTAVVAYALGTFSLLMGIAYLPGQEYVTWEILQSRSVISLALILLGWLAIITWQIRRRSVGLPYAIWTFLALVIPLVMWGWSGDIFASWRARVKDSSEQTSGIAIAPVRASIGYKEGEANTLELQVRAEGTPSGLVLAGAAADLKWQAHSGLLRASISILGDGSLGSNRGPAVLAMLGLPKVAPDAETVRWMEEKRLEGRKKMPQTGQWTVVPSLSPEETRKLLQLRLGLQGTARFEPPTAKTVPEMRADFVLARPRLLMELPLQQSRWVTVDGHSVRIAQVRSVTRPAPANGLSTAREERQVHFVATQPEGEWIAPLWHLFHVGTPMVLAPDVWLVNRELGQATNDGLVAAYFPGVRIAGVQLAWRWATVSEPRVIRNGVWTGYLPDWDKQYTLVFFGYPQVGQFRRTFKLEKIKDNRKTPEETAEPTP